MVAVGPGGGAVTVGVDGAAGCDVGVFVGVLVTPGEGEEAGVIVAGGAEAFATAKVIRLLEATIDPEALKNFAPNEY
jgi:hypothetical protein